MGLGFMGLEVLFRLRSLELRAWGLAACGVQHSGKGFGAQGHGSNFSRVVWGFEDC